MPQGSKILIVEDEVSISTMIHHQLDKLGYVVVGQTATGESAIHMSSEKKPDLILMDIHINGDIDGIQATKEIHHMSDIPVVFLTAYSDNETVNQALTTNAYNFLIKPYNLRELFLTIEFVLSRHKIEKQLHSTEKKYLDVASTLHEGILVIDAGASIIYANECVAEMLGYARVEIQGKCLLDFVEERNLKDNWDYTENGIRFKERFESEFLKKEGTRINVIIAVTSTQDENGDYSGAIVVVTDITCTLQRQQKYLDLFRQNTEAMIILNAEYFIIYANPAAEKIFRRSLEELSGIPFGFPVTSGELTEIEIPRQDGTVAVCEIRFSGILWEDKPAYMVIIRDITERKRLEKKIQDSETSYHDLFNTVGEAIWIIDVDGRLLEINQGALDMYGKPRDFFLGKSFDILFSPGTFDIGQILSKFESAFYHESQIFEFEGFNGNRGTFLAECRFYKGYYFGKEVIIGLVIDITERKKMMDQIKASLAEKEIMLKEIHHRVKNNLQTVTSLLNLQIRGLNDPKIINALHDTQSRVRSMWLVHEHLYRSNIISRMDLGNYIQALSIGIFQSYGLLVKKIKPDIALRGVMVDITLAIPLGLICNELITNCMKYAYPDHATGDLIITGTEDDEKLTLIVQDHGIGIPDDIDFEHQNTLGLRMVKSLTSQINARVILERKGGTKYTFTIPKTEKMKFVKDCM